MPDTHTEGRPGFQGSETSWVEATFYRHGNDPVVVTGNTKIPLIGRKPQDPWPSLFSATVTKAMGAPSGNFVLQMKPSKVSQALFEELVDDDWVDIVIYRHDQPWHVMRGLIDEIRRSKTVAGSGATTEVYTISGRDFGKVWELTPVWFDPYANDYVTQAISNSVLKAMPEFLGNPADVVETFFKRFMEEVATRVGPNWEPPPGVPNVEAGSFLNSVVFETRQDFRNIPARSAFNPGQISPNGTLWALAQQYSDPAFTEMWVDLLPEGDPMSSKIAAGTPLAPGDVRMTVVLRDKPFPVVDNFLHAADVGWEDRWANIPVSMVPRQQIFTSDLGRSGLERFNAFFVATLLHQELMNGSAPYMLAPLLDKKEIKRHGIRRMDVQSQQRPDGRNALEYTRYAEIQRRLLRDWYCLNPYFLNGTLNLAVGRPDIKIGCRVRVPATVDEGSEENYYVEQWNHNWTFGTSVKTNLGVTRGWRGDDDEYLRSLEFASTGYEIPALKNDT